jgi:hypothetical protein
MLQGDATGTYLKPEYENVIGVNGIPPGITFCKQIKMARFQARFRIK